METSVSSERLSFLLLALPSPQRDEEAHETREEANGKRAEGPARFSAAISEGGPYTKGMLMHCSETSVPAYVHTYIHSYMNGMERRGRLLLCLICASVEKGSRRGGATGSQCESDALVVSLGVFHRCCVATSHPPYTLPTPSTSSLHPLHPPYTLHTRSTPSLHPLHPPYTLYTLPTPSTPSLHPSYTPSLHPPYTLPTPSLHLPYTLYTLPTPSLHPYTFPTPSTPSLHPLHPPYTLHTLYTLPTPSTPTLHPLHPPFILPSTYLQQYFKICSQAIEQLKRTGPSPYPHKFVVDISLSEFQTRFEDVPARERREDVVVSVAGGWGLVGAGGVD